MTKFTKDIMAILSILIIGIIAFVAGPLVTIWALNTLFPVLAIPYTIYSWLAVVALSVFAKSNITISRS